MTTVLEGPGQGPEPLPTALSAADILDAAAARIEPKGCWTQKAAARGAGGQIAVNEADATCWCGWQSIREAWGYPKINGSYSFEPLDAAMEFAAQAIGVGTQGEFIRWNDDKGRTQAEVAAALRRAAQLAREADAKHLGAVSEEQSS